MSVLVSHQAENANVTPARNDEIMTRNECVSFKTFPTFYRENKSEAQKYALRF